MQNEELSPLLTISDAAKEAKISRQGIYVAIKHGRLKAHQKKLKWFIEKADLDAYRASRYIGDNRKNNGERIFSLEKGIYSVHQVSKFMSLEMGFIYPLNKVYYKLRRGHLKASRTGGAWVIKKEDVIKLLESEKAWHARRAVGGV